MASREDEMACVEISRAQKKGNKFSMTYQTSFKRAMEVGQCEGENRIIMHRGDVKWHKNVVLLSLRRLVERERKKMRSRRRHKNGSSWGEGGKSIDECFPFRSLTRLLPFLSLSVNRHWMKTITDVEGSRRVPGTWFRFSYLISQSNSSVSDYKSEFFLPVRFPLKKRQAILDSFGDVGRRARSDRALCRWAIGFATYFLCSKF